MNADQPPTIFGWTPTGPAIIAGGVVIAIVVGSISMAVGDPLPPKIAWLFAAAIPLLLVSAMARTIWRRRLAKPTPVLILGVTIKLANLIAVILLGLAALAAFAIGYEGWQSLAKAFVIDLMLGGLLSVATAIAGNVAAFSTSQPPPSTPSA